MITTEFRKAISGLSAEKISMLTGKKGFQKVSISTISQWKYNNIVPSIENAEKVLKALGYELKIVKKEGN